MNLSTACIERKTDSCRTYGLIVLFLLSFYLLFASLHVGSGDGVVMYQVTRALVETRSFAIPPPSPWTVVVDHWGEPIPPGKLRHGGQYGAWGVDGRYYAQYGVGQSLLAVPFYVLGRWVHQQTQWGTVDFAARVGVMLLNPLVLALVGCVVYQLAQQLGYGRGAALGVALVVCLATPLWVYSKTFFSEPLVALGFVVATLAAVRGDQGNAAGWAICGVALGMAVLVKPVTLAVLPAFLIYAASHQHRRGQALALMVGPLLLGISAVAIYNAVRFGSPLDPGYRTAAWNVPPWVGLYGLLLIPGKGLFWCCPSIVRGLAGWFPLARRQPRAARLLAGVSILYLLVHSAYNHWHGGGAWGPRLILPIVPLLVLPLAEWLQRPVRQSWARLGLAAVLVAGFVVQLPAVLVHPARTLQSLYDRSASPTQYTVRQMYRIVDSPLRGQWQSLLDVSGLVRHAPNRAALVQIAQKAREGALAPNDGLVEAVGILSFNSYFLWPVLWGMLGARVLPLALVELVLAAIAGWAYWQLWKSRTHSEI